jgi:sulfite reductase (NADPH) flavoprotein alpha-component
MHPVYILFGTESGNAQGLAKRAGEAVAKAGLTPKVVDMMDFAGEKLVELRRLLVITSTYGNGDPPSNAEALHAYLMKKCPPLPDLVFSVCALGDTTYDRFAQCGKDFDRRLGELGATRIADRKDCDVDYDDAFDAWLEKALSALKALDSPAPGVVGENVVIVVESIPPPPSHDPAGTRRNPVMARVTKNINLHKPGGTKETRHVELTFVSEPLRYELGDSVGVWPTNDPALVREVLDVSGLAGSERVRVGADDLTIEAALSTKLDIVLPDVRLLEHAFGALTSERRKELLADHHVIDVLVSKRPRFGAADLVSLLRPLAPRQYSIASSPLEHPNEVHLTVAVVRYDLRGRARGGVASLQLADRAPEGTVLPVYLHTSPRFRLAPPDTDIIMIGPGTGVAPYRSFLEERRHHHGKGRAWLFFGARHRATDFLYESDFEAFEREGVLTRKDIAFSRDQDGKVYVQDRMREHEREIYEWLEGGAIVYVCGDASRMAPDVHSMLAGILHRQGGISDTAAREQLDAWLEAGRYRKDVY